VASEQYPRAFSFTQSEDHSVHQFITAPRLADNFWLSVSPQAMSEIRVLQQVSSDLILDSNVKDKWVYDWGTPKYTSQKYYQYAS
jgi:hypothetical protein